MYFSSFDIDPCPSGPYERSPKYEVDSEVALHIHYHKVGKDEGVSYSYENVFDIPSGYKGYRMVESASCTSIVVGERVGYSSASYITLGIIVMLAPHRIGITRSV